jgi:hypothetical protein
VTSQEFVLKIIQHHPLDTKIYVHKKIAEKNTYFGEGQSEVK